MFNHTGVLFCLLEGHQKFSARHGSSCCNPSSWDTEVRAGEYMTSQVQGQALLHGETLSKKVICYNVWCAFIKCSVGLF